ncbi:uncharacterized protein LOC18428013 isoform X2 [Amborella trichopoda]|uniref:uncharacterized protein LOC18428013 isoform X2 n=1 Tax=Amborella trichopoda TaxID=13333 RepID=UPI0005D433FC|nr:uncharacterized protein LOC18428013 isoform X2 [Amborella trichopoda]|eukprot:XP_011621100.1 uncharacterized protein LOC18428013 isoform X2 [Amborella trichopoda]
MQTLISIPASSSASSPNPKPNPISGSSSSLIWSRNPCSNLRSETPVQIRLWRPAAQRNIRNQWSTIVSQKQKWSSASSNGRSLASSLVNAYLSCRYLPSMDLGVLSSMNGIRDKAHQKLAQKQVSTVCQMVRASQSMRCFLKGSLDSPIVEFCSQPGNSDDCGDGRGVPVFSYLSVTYFESLAQELTQMFVLELNLKRLLVAALCCITCDDGINTQANVLNWSNELFPGEFENMGSIGLLNEESCLPIPPCIQGRENGDTNMERLSQHPEREVMQVYLTVWLAEVNINTRRVDEIIAMVEEEMQLKLGSS